MTRLTEHFVSGEFDCRDGTPCPPHYLDQLPHLCHEYLEPLRREFGVVHIVSGFRSRSHNTRIGGATRSFHLDVTGRQGVAADVVCRRGTAPEWHRFLDRLAPGGLGRYTSFVHVDSRRAISRW